MARLLPPFVCMHLPDFEILNYAAFRVVSGVTLLLLILGAGLVSLVGTYVVLQKLFWLVVK
jgi:hypothetical protein